MPGKGVKVKPSKKGRSTNSNSALLPLKDKSRQQQGKGKGKGRSQSKARVNGMQKAKDLDAREALNQQDSEIRFQVVRELNQEPEPLVQPKPAPPTELNKRGTQLASALDDLVWD